MSAHRLPVGRTAVAAACLLPLLVIAAPPAHPAPEADSQGYVDSTASCASPATVVVFGSTRTSRVAICRDTDGSYQYRGVRVRDGARLILPAQRSGDATFTAENDGIEYRVSSSSLVISSGQRVLRDEPMLDFHAGSAQATTTGPGESPAAAATATPTTPLPPPLPAEVGGGDSS
ncbi:MAG: hypothetical protein SW019_02245 [Actinomycetota bacterium]|nr:hypothetical protein [Actinomycetota bacterium]